MSASKYECCPTCHKSAWMQTHQCAPTWDWRYYWTGEKADDWVVGQIHARDAENAAEDAAKAYDSEDYPLSRGGDVMIEVRLTGTEDVTRWNASVEMEPRYIVTADEA